MQHTKRYYSFYVLFWFIDWSLPLPNFPWKTCFPVIQVEIKHIWWRVINCLPGCRIRIRRAVHTGSMPTMCVRCRRDSMPRVCVFHRWIWYWVFSWTNECCQRWGMLSRMCTKERYDISYYHFLYYWVPYQVSKLYSSCLCTYCIASTCLYVGAEWSRSM